MIKLTCGNYEFVAKVHGTYFIRICCTASLTASVQQHTNVCVFLPPQGEQDESELEDTGESREMHNSLSI